LENDIEKAANLISISATFWPWLMTGNTSEARDWCSSILVQLDAIPEQSISDVKEFSKLKARVLNRYSQALMNLGDHQASRAAAEESIQLARTHKDLRTLADALGSLGHCALYAGDQETAFSAAKEGIEISERLDTRHEQIWTLDAMVHINYINGNDDEVEKYYAKINEILTTAGVGIDPVYRSGFFIEKAIKQGDMQEAERQMESALEILLDHRDNYMLATLQSMVAHALRQYGDFDKATYYYQKTIRLWQERGHRAAIAHQLECFGFIALAQENAPRAAKLLSAAESTRNIINSVRTPPEQKEFEEAKSHLQMGLNPEILEKFWREGQSMTLEQAVELALSDTASQDFS